MFKKYRRRLAALMAAALSLCGASFPVMAEDGVASIHLGTFVSEYAPGADGGSFVVSGISVELSGKALSAGEIGFSVSEKTDGTFTAGRPEGYQDSVYNSGDGSVSFAVGPFEEPGRHYYAIKQETEKTQGGKYIGDGHEAHATVTVSEDGGRLKVSSDVSGGLFRIEWRPDTENPDNPENGNEDGNGQDEGNGAGGSEPGSGNEAGPGKGSQSENNASGSSSITSTSENGVSQPRYDTGIITVSETVVPASTKWKIVPTFAATGVSSSDKRIAKATLKKKKGYVLLRARKAGAATVTVEGPGGRKQEYRIYVEKPKMNKSALKVSTPSTLDVTGYISGLIYLRPEQVTSKDTSVATVSANGALRVMKSGKSRITARFGKKKLTGTVKAKIAGT